MKVPDHLGLRAALEPLAVRPLAFEFRRFDSGEMLHRLALGARATHITEQADAVHVTLADGRRFSAELLVGADGIKSVVRQRVLKDLLKDLGEDRPVYTGQLAWRCMVATENIPPALRTALVSTIWCGPKNHGVTYYLRGGALLNFVGCVERAWEEESWTACRPWEELDADYAGWHPMVRAVVERVDRSQCFRWALNHRTPSTRWSTARVTMLGDAVHATLPYMAQGAAMAIEDAAVLARLLSEPGVLHEQLRRYEAHRAPRTARVVRESTEMGELYHITDAQAMREAFVARDLARSRNEWLYPYDPLRVPIA